MSSRFVIVLCIVTSASYAQPCSENVVGSYIYSETGNFFCPERDNYITVFKDDFDGNSLNFSRWDTIFGWGPVLNGNALEAMKHHRNVWIENGILNLRVAYDPGEYERWYYDENGFQVEMKHFDYTAGMIRSRSSYSRGYFEIRCKIPNIDGAWPAFWLYGGCQQEIDVFEFWRNNGDDISLANSEPYITVHQGKSTDCSQRCSEGIRYNSSVQFNQEWHTYAVEWNRQTLVFYIDGQEVNRKYRWYDAITLEAANCDSPNGEYVRDPYYPHEDNAMEILVSIGAHADYASNITESVMQVDYVLVKEKIDCNSQWDICSSADLQYHHDNDFAAQVININNGDCSWGLESKEVYRFHATDQINIYSDFDSNSNNDVLMTVSPCNTDNYQSGKTDHSGNNLVPLSSYRNEEEPCDCITYDHDKGVTIRNIDSDKDVVFKLFDLSGAMLRESTLAPGEVVPIEASRQFRILVLENNSFQCVQKVIPTAF